MNLWILGRVAVVTSIVIIELAGYSSGNPEPIIFRALDEDEYEPTNFRSPDQVHNKRAIPSQTQQQLWITTSPKPIANITTTTTTSPPPDEISTVLSVIESTTLEMVEAKSEGQGISKITLATESPLRKLGEACDPSNKDSICVANASCLKMAEDENDFVCDCNETFEETASGNCVRREGSLCNYRLNECSQGQTYLTCVNSRCICEKSDEYNSYTKKCEGRVGATCFHGKDCVVNAHCSKISYFNSEGVCECKKGFVESENGICLRGYGRTCSRNEDCDSIHLVCKEGYCNCSDSLQKYDFKSHSCLSVVGGGCPVDESERSYSQYCIDGAYCKITNRKLSGRCVCTSNLVQSVYRTCVPQTFIQGYGSSQNQNSYEP